MACQTDSHSRFLAAAFEGGVIQVHNLASGALLFNRLAVESMKLDHEVNILLCMNESTPFWFMVGCWEGEVGFVSKT